MKIKYNSKDIHSFFHSIIDKFKELKIEISYIYNISSDIYFTFHVYLVLIFCDLSMIQKVMKISDYNSYKYY